MAAYRFALYGIIPPIGVVFGPVAVVLGILGWRDSRAHPGDRALGHAGAAVILGVLELLTHSVGLAFIWIGLASLFS